MWIWESLVDADVFSWPFNRRSVKLKPALDYVTLMALFSQVKYLSYCSDETQWAKRWACEHRWLGQCFATCIINLKEKLLKAHLVFGKAIQGKKAFRRKWEGHSGKGKSKKVQRYFLLTSVNRDSEEAVKPCQRYWEYRSSWAKLLILTYKPPLFSWSKCAQLCCVSWKNVHSGSEMFNSLTLS